MQVIMLLLQHLLTLKDGLYDVIVEDHHEKASSKQFGWLFGGIYPALLPEFISLGWEFTSVDDVDNFFEQRFRGREFVNRNSGEVIRLPQSLKDMNTVEMSEYCDRILDFSTEYLGVDISSLLPDKYRKQTDS